MIAREKEGERDSSLPPIIESDKQLGTTASLASAASATASRPVAKSAAAPSIAASSNIHPSAAREQGGVHDAESSSPSGLSTASLQQKRLIPVVRRKTDSSKIDRERFPSQSPTRVDFLDSRKKNQEATINQILITEREQEARIKDLTRKHGREERKEEQLKRRGSE